jgi:Flavin containing amine oxidoreductase
MGSWTALGPGGSPADRRLLGTPIDDRFVLAGDCTNPTQPSMVHGAYEEGLRAAEWAASAMPVGGNVVVEGRNRIGGRAHSVDIGGVVADAGAAWLQQIDRNPLARLATRLGLATRPTDFHRPLASAADGPVGDVAAARDSIPVGVDETVDLHTVLQPFLRSLTAEQRRVAQFAVDLDIDLENGVLHDRLSAKWVLNEPGVGDGDAWLPGGYRQLAAHLAIGVDVRFNTSVQHVRWDDHGVTVNELRGDCCICTIPAWLAPALDLQPGLPATHRAALAHLSVGVVEKVILRFDERWWPHDGNGYLRWYDAPASWGEWLDLTDGVGQPCVAALIAREGVERRHRGRSDAEVANDVAAALARWADALGAF